MVLQWPRLRIIADSARRRSARAIRPARTSSLISQTPVPQPRSLPSKRPLSMGPPVTMSVGRSTDAAPISSDGTVLSHPPSSTTPSTGLARMSSSTTMAARSRKNMAVGRSKRLAQRGHRQLQRHPARFPHTALDVLGDLAEVPVARA